MQPQPLGCWPARLALKIGGYSSLHLLPNHMKQECLPARWAVPGDLGDFHRTQERRERLCKMIAIMLSMFVIIFIEGSQLLGVLVSFSSRFLCRQLCALIFRE